LYRLTLKYAKELTKRVALAGGRSRKLIHSRTIENEALTLANELAKWENSKQWLALMFQTAGYKERKLTCGCVSNFLLQLNLHASKWFDHELGNMENGLPLKFRSWNWDLQEAIRHEATVFDQSQVSESQRQVPHNSLNGLIHREDVQALGLSQRASTKHYEVVRQEGMA
jgi:hypothetical protein